ncbi:MAG: RnfABCDGE type electron transport complex subunit D [Pseudomonadota bacterium]
MGDVTALLSRWLRPRDPRPWQIFALTMLLTVGTFVLGFDLSPWHPPVVLGAALITQWIGARWIADLPFDPLSPAITALSLSLLLRTDALWLSALGAAVAIGSKFLIRFDGRHIFNPANLTLVALPILFSGAWISPGQWGSAGLLAVVIAGAGAAVAGHAARLDTTLAFLAAWAALSFGRALWLGDPMAIPIHQLQSGAVLVFAFFMISDPATTPVHRSTRILHAIAVAGLGFALQTAWITNAGAIMALVLLAPIVPVLNRFSAQRSSQRETRPCSPSRPPELSPARP